MKKKHKEDFEIGIINDFIDRTSVLKTEFDLGKLQIKQFYENELVQVKSENISDILKIKNPYLSFYLLLNCANDIFNFNEKDVIEIYRILLKIKPILKDREISNKFILICLKQMRGISIHGSIKVLSMLNLSQKNIEQIRKVFGYNVIYKTYKTIIENIYFKDYTSNELGLVMKLLDNEKLSFSRSLDTFNRFSEYISKEIIDKNLTSCCTVLIAIIKYAPSMIIDKKVLLNGILTYLINILFDRSNFTFYDQNDADILINTIETLCDVDSVKLSSYDFKTGLVRRCLFNLNQFLESNSSIYEEVMSFISILRSLGIFINLCHNTKSLENQPTNRFKIVVLEKKNNKSSNGIEKIEFETTGFLKKISSLITPSFINDLEKYRLPDNLCLGYKDDELAKIRFISAKFYVLNNISKITDILINRVHFYNDVYSQNRPKFIFDNLGDLKQQISWSDLIILATHSPSKFDFIPILLDTFYIKNLEHLSYIFLFVFSLKDDYDSVLYLTISLVELESFNDIDKYWEILIYIFIHYLEVNDERMRKTRLYIIKKCIRHPETLENILRILVRDCNKDKISINCNLYPLFYFLIFNLKKIDTELFFDSYIYIVTRVNNGHKKSRKNKNNKSDRLKDKLESMCIHDKTYIILKSQNYIEEDKLFKKLTRKTLNVALMIQLMNIYKPTAEETKKAFTFDSFYHCVAVSTYILMNKLEVETLKVCLFGFILNCPTKQRKQLKIIFSKYKKSKYYKCFRFLNKLLKQPRKPQDCPQDL